MIPDNLELKFNDYCQSCELCDPYIKRPICHVSDDGHYARGGCDLYGIACRHEDACRALYGRIVSIDRLG